MNKIELITLIREQFNKLFNEAREEVHSLERGNDRIKLKDFISPQEMKIFEHNLDVVKKTDFSEKRSYALMLVQLVVDKTSIYAEEINGKYYYKIKDEAFQNSIGNQIWIIVRDNKIQTTMLRRDVQTENLKTAANEIGVDFAVKMGKNVNFDKFSNYIKNGLKK